MFFFFVSFMVLSANSSSDCLFFVSSLRQVGELQRVLLVSVEIPVLIGYFQAVLKKADGILMLIRPLL